MRFVSRSSCAFTLALAAAVAQESFVPKDLKAPPARMAAGFGDFDIESCKQWLGYLAGPECEGRGTGQAGYDKAADFVAGKFKEWGLAPCGDKGTDGKPTYFQMVPFSTTAIDPASCSAEFVSGQTTVAPKLGEGLGVTGAGTLAANGPVIAIAADGADRAFPDFDVAGKIVLLLAYDAKQSTDGAPAFAGRIRFMTKLAEAKPAAIVRVSDVNAARGAGEQEWMRADQFDRGGNRGAPEGRAPSVYLSRAVADQLLQPAGTSVAKLVDAARKAAAPQKTDVKARAKLAAKSARRDKGVPNVVGHLEGSDPKLKHELVIMGSHLDHLGRAADGTMYPGADDDGSGSTALLAMARAFSKNPTRPKRSLMFIAVCGEEKGLLGSDWYVEHPLFPIKDTVAELQLDMVGRREEAHPSENPGNEKAEDNLNSLHLVGSKRISTELHDIVLKNNKDHVGFDFEFDGEKYYERSDHYNFARKGIPIAFMFTGVHMDYHQPTDTPDKIDYMKLKRTASLTYLVAFEIGDREKRLVSDVATPKVKRPKNG